MDWCSRMRIFPADPGYRGAGQEIVLPDVPAGQRLQVLRDRGVTNLICGALSPELHNYAHHLGIQIICGVAGEVSEVLQSFWRNQLDQPQFRLPGCRRPGRQRGRGAGEYGVCQRRGGGPQPLARPGRNSRKAAGPAARGEACRCEVCGEIVPREPGVACRQLRCSRCGRPLVRS